MREAGRERGAVLGFDLVVKGGRVIDPSQGLDEATGPALSGRKVAATPLARGGWCHREPRPA